MIPVLFIYLLKLTVSLGLVYLFYRLVLQNLTFYNWNRYYLLSFTALCFTIPLIDVAALWEGTRKAAMPAIVHYIPQVEVMASTGLIRPELTTPAFSLWDLLLIVWVSGILVMLVRTSLPFFSFIRIRRMASLISNQGIKLYHVDANILPFSFGRSIFLNRSLLKKDDLTNIIRHELVHVQQNHTADIIWMELVCILNWYNPFAWLLRQQARQNLEFIADNHVLQSGTDKKYYQYLLLQVTGVSAFHLANQFNFSTLKKRIMMMNKIPSKGPELAKFLFLLPLMAILLLAFRTAESPGETKNKAPEFVKNTLNIPGQGKPAKGKDRKNLVNFNPVEGNIILVVFQDGTEEKYDLSTEAGKQSLRTAQLYKGDSYNPSDTARHWSPEFETFLRRNPQITKFMWRYDMEDLNKGNFVYPADRLYFVLKSGVEVEYPIENKAHLNLVENKFGKLPNIPPPSPSISVD